MVKRILFHPKNEDLNKIAGLALEGLTTDGAHHKQWYLWQIVEKLGFDMDKVRELYQPEEGIAP